MIPTHAAAELDSLIEEITVDSHDQDEQLMSSEAAFDDDDDFPCSGTVVGEEVQVLSASRADSRHELVATCQRNGHRYEIALLDINLNTDPDTSRLIAAYRRWIGTRIVTCSNLQPCGRDKCNRSGDPVRMGRRGAAGSGGRGGRR